MSFFSPTIQTLYDFTGSNGPKAFLEFGILAFFVFAVLSTIVSCFDRKTTEPGIFSKIVVAPNFTYLSTIIAGLILTAASGTLGASAKLPVAPGQEAAAVASAPSAVGAAQTASPGTADRQKEAFKTLCTWIYLILGVPCFFLFALPTPRTHDLVRNVGLTTIGFAVTIFAGL